MVVDCGGGTVDITVHEVVSAHRPVAELHKVCGAPFGSAGALMLLHRFKIVEFECLTRNSSLLCCLFHFLTSIPCN